MRRNATGRAAQLSVAEKIGYHLPTREETPGGKKQQGVGNPPFKSKSTMSNFNIEIKSLEEKMAADAPTLERYNIGNGIEAEETTCLIHETVDIGTILFFASKIPVEVCTYFRLTAEQFTLLVGAFWGAQTRFQQPITDHITASMGGQEQQQKLLDAGFKIYRFSWYEGTGGKISYCHTPGAWRLFEGGFTTKAALLRRKKELMKDPKSLEG